MGTTLAIFGKGRSNNFNLIRMIAACSVLVSHSYALAPYDGEEPLQGMLGMSLGGVAVIAFFVLSGFFIAQSLDRRVSIADFATARVFRIWPALVIMLFLCAFVLGPLVTELPRGEYLSRRGVFGYVIRNTSLFWGRYDLPGVFTANHFPNVVNGSLWSLAYEVECYAVLALVIILSPRHSFYKCAAIVAANAAFLWSTSEDLLSPHNRVIISFALGAVGYQLRDHIPLRWDLLGIIAVLAGLTRFTPIWIPACIIVLGYGVAVLGAVESDLLRSYNKLGDYSYGTYIYAFPLQQCFALLFPKASPASMIAATLPAVVLAAWLSWTFVERPCLSYRHAVVSHLRRKLGWMIPGFLTRLSPSRP